MVDETSGRGAGTPPGGPDKKIVYAVIAVVVVILAIVLIAKFGYNTDLLNPAGGQMSLVHNSLATNYQTGITRLPTTGYAVIRTTIPGRNAVCLNGQIGCSGTCVNVNTDNQNCGSCGNACAAGATCTAGQCICPSGQSQCGGNCINTATDVFNCGSCKNVCQWGNICRAGQCQCGQGQTVCGGNCVDTSQDLNNCGSCGNVCPTPGSSQQPRNCVSGKCTSGCTTGETWCGGGDCIHTQFDPNNCGHCGVVCPAGKTCWNSGCLPK